MLLETLDILKSDVIIYSENRFDFQENFKIIFKREVKKAPKEIDYFEVCKFVRDPTPKNLIVYRLLTNVRKLNAYSTKYGYFINSQNGFELIYFDPIFALKDIANLNFELDPKQFRFKIQQTGFSGIESKNDEAFYREVYTFDLRAIEAQNQNDKVFVEAIYALDENFSLKKTAGNLDFKESSKKTEVVIEEDNSHEGELRKADFQSGSDGLNYNEHNINQLKNSFREEWDSSYQAYSQFKLKNVSSGKSENKKLSFSDFLNEHRTESEKDDSNIFGSNSEAFKGRDESVILRFKE